MTNSTTTTTTTDDGLHRCTGATIDGQCTNRTASMRCTTCNDALLAACAKLHGDTAAAADAAVGPIVGHYRLPARFYDDHADRGCPAGRVTRRLARSVDVALDEAAIADLRSDAQHYADSDEYDAPMRSAARSMLAGLTRQGL
jgi:hypothetical protein